MVKVKNDSDPDDETIARACDRYLDEQYQQKDVCQLKGEFGRLLRHMRDPTTKECAIAGLGFERMWDAQRRDPKLARSVLERKGREDSEDARILRAQLQVARLRHKTLEELMRAQMALVRALKLEIQADRLNKEIYRPLELATGKRVRRQLPSLWIVAALTTALTDELSGTPDGGTSGYGTRKRQNSVNEDLKALHSKGVMIREIAFLLGYPPAKCVRDAQGWTVARRRILGGSRVVGARLRGDRFCRSKSITPQHRRLDPTCGHAASQTQSSASRKASRSRRRS